MDRASLFLFRLCPATAVVGVSLLAAPAFGQATAGSSPPPPRRYESSSKQDQMDFDYNGMDAQESRMKLLTDLPAQASSWDDARLFAKCAIKLSADRSRGLMDEATGGKPVEMTKYLQRTNGCTRSAMKLDRDFLRGALAEELLAGEGAGDVVIPPGGDAAKVKDFIQAVKVPSKDMKDPFVRAQMTYECRIGFSPIAARALMATEARSDAEKGALAAMKAVTPQCDSLGNGAELMTPAFERAFSSQALYNWIAFAGGV